MKQSDYEQEFAQAMQTKLRLNREARSQVTETSQDASAQSDNNGATELPELNSTGVDGPPSRPYRRDSSGDVGRTRLVADEEVAKRYEKAGLRIPSINQLDAAQSAADYAQRMQSAMVNHKYGAQVELKAADELSKYKLYQTDDDAGFALKPDGDVVAVYSGASEPRNGLFSVLQAAIDQGGRKLDAFDTMLPDIYETVGFKPVARVAWNDQFAPKPPFAAKAWDKETYKQFNNGEPDIVLMVYDLIILAA